MFLFTTSINKISDHRSQIQQQFKTRYNNLKNDGGTFRYVFEKNNEHTHY